MRFTNSCTLGALHLKNGFIMAPVKTASAGPTADERGRPTLFRIYSGTRSRIAS